jgi:hypothetical protein
MAHVHAAAEVESKIGAVKEALRVFEEDFLPSQVMKSLTEPANSYVKHRVNVVIQYLPTPVHISGGWTRQMGRVYSMLNVQLLPYLSTSTLFR